VEKLDPNNVGNQQTGHEERREPHVEDLRGGEFDRGSMGFARCFHAFSRLSQRQSHSILAQSGAAVNPRLNSLTARPVAPQSPFPLVKRADFYSLPLVRRN
jgi:hypothetical protein